MTDPRPAPYPATTKAKGWRFELDYEAIQQSDTWALADEVPMAQPALLMMWLTAWAQIPCGSFPNDEAVIRAKCKIPAKDWPKLREVLMRGWWLADDGRMYHPTITQRVLDMLGRKEAERKRKSDYRARMEAERKLADANAQAQMSHGTDVDMSHGTTTGHDGDGRGKDATGTGTGTGTGLDSSNPPPRAGEGPDLSHGTEAGRVCRLMKSTGLTGINPGHPTLRVLIDAGATDDEFIAAARSAVAKKAGFAYALTVVTNERQRAADVAKQVHRGPMPARTPQAAGDTPHALRQLEQAQALAPGAARRSPAAPLQSVVIDIEEARHVVAIEGR